MLAAEAPQCPWFADRVPRDRQSQVVPNRQPGGIADDCSWLLVAAPPLDASVYGPGPRPRGGAGRALACAARAPAAPGQPARVLPRVVLCACRRAGTGRAAAGACPARVAHPAGAAHLPAVTHGDA